MKELKVLPDTRPLENPDKIYTFSKEAIDSYARACIAAADIAHQIQPDLIICPLRGGYLPTQVAASLPDGCGDMEVAWVPASFSVKGRKQLLKSAAMKYGRLRTHEQGPGKVVSIDAAISDESIDGFRELAGHIVPDVMKLLGARKKTPLEYTLITLQPGAKAPDGSAVLPDSSREYSEHGYTVVVHEFRVGVEQLLAHGDPNLLGIDYQTKLPSGQFSPYLVRVNAKNKIVVEGNANLEFRPNEDQTTADLLVRIVADAAKTIKSQKK